MGRHTGRNPLFVLDHCEKSKRADGGHFVVREIKKIWWWPWRRRDRMVCEWCGGALFDWGESFRPNPLADRAGNERYV